MSVVFGRAARTPPVRFSVCHPSLRHSARAPQSCPWQHYRHCPLLSNPECGKPQRGSSAMRGRLESKFLWSCQSFRGNTCQKQHVDILSQAPISITTRHRMIFRIFYCSYPSAAFHATAEAPGAVFRRGRTAGRVMNPNNCVQPEAGGPNSDVSM